MSGCLTDDQVLAFVSAELAPSDRCAADEHLASCADCRSVLAEAARSLYDPDSSLASSRAQTLWGAHRRRPADVPLQPLTAGTSVGRYQIVRQVGRGGSGVVYEAFDPQLGRKVAIKMVRPDTRDEASQGPSRLLREAQAMARLAHPHVVYVHDAGTFEGQVFVAMEYVDGWTVGQWLQQSPRDWREVLRVFIEAGRGLAAAHEAGIVHRDFKPENVLIGNDGRPRVTDFGLARSNAPGDEMNDTPSDELHRSLSAPLELHPLLTLTEAGALAGTPAYMAPEQWKGARADERSDQFNFCAALWKSLCGQRPFGEGPGETVTMTALARAVLAGELRPPPPGTPIPAGVFAALERGLSADPGARFPSVAALLEELISASAPAEPAPPPGERRPSRLLPRALGAAGILAAAAAALILTTHTPARSAAPPASAPWPVTSAPVVKTLAVSITPTAPRTPPAPPDLHAAHAGPHHPVHHVHHPVTTTAPPAPAKPAEPPPPSERYGERLKDPFAANPGRP